MIYDIDATTVQHFLVSAWLMIICVFLIKNKMLCVGLVLCVGLGKELFDPAFNVMDLMANLAGICGGYYVTKGVPNEA